MSDRDGLRDRIKRHRGGRSGTPIRTRSAATGAQSIGYGCRLPLTVREAEVLFDTRYGNGLLLRARRVLEGTHLSHRDLSCAPVGCQSWRCASSLASGALRRFKS